MKSRLKVILLLAGLAIGGSIIWMLVQNKPARMAAAIANYELSLDAYAQTDTTITEVTNREHADGRKAGLISAFFGLDNALPEGVSDRVVCKGAGGADGMPVIFSHEVDIETLEPGDFKITQASGTAGKVSCLTLAPADDSGELRTALLAGEYGSAEDQPVMVEIVGDVLSLDGTINFKGTSIIVTPLEDGPTLVWAEIVPRERWNLGSEGTFLAFGGGTGCPAETKQIVLVTWNGGVTKPGGAPAGNEERDRYIISVLGDDGLKTNITPFALADLNDGDNNHKLCLDTAAAVSAITFPAGYLTDPREDLNPETTVVPTDLVQD